MKLSFNDPRTSRLENRIAMLLPADGVSLVLRFTSLGNNMFTFEDKGSGVDLRSITYPVSVIFSGALIAAGLPWQLQRTERLDGGC
jgi:hypothetical protein